MARPDQPDVALFPQERHVCDVTITGLGTSGDGMALLDGRSVFVPGALPGETLRVALAPKGAPEILDILAASPARVTPPCPLFGPCGGCSLQMMRLDTMLDWKTARIQAALRNAGFVVQPEPTAVQTPPMTRRRLDLAVARVPGGMVIGLHRRNGPPVDMTLCHVADPALTALLEPLRRVLGGLGALTGEATLQINLLDSGADIVLGTGQELTASDRAKLADFAAAHDVPRISWQKSGQPGIVETVAQLKPVRQSFGPLTVAPPPGIFLQATRQGESAIVDAVLNALPPLNRKDVIVELYAGCGTLTGPLSTCGRVSAYEGVSEAVAALQRARTGHRLEAERRDLVRQPLLAGELTAARVVVLDPPHAGAPRQIEEIARSGVRDVVYVSCNPRALEKDAARLREAGYALVAVTVVDQFLWSAEVEAVIALTKDPKRLRKHAA
ncbi:class I SAM-dependent RNA methyltransferase [Acidomonas methanolica]|uniref:class I SAM-dependent RNA methyltransferase n=1 Tax=Acidomonas methanolica TaxID=437 RepID=UPI00211A00B2